MASVHSEGEMRDRSVAGRDFHLLEWYGKFMNRDDVLARLKHAEAELRSRGVIHAALFGSVARGEEELHSDIDVMVEIDPDTHRRLDLFQYISLVHVIEDLFPTRVDVSNRTALKEHIRPSAERDAIFVF